MEIFKNSHLTYSPNVNSINDPHHEYVDIQIVHNDENNKDPIPVAFNQIKTQNILDNAEDYYLSVIRWNLDSCLPIIIPQMELANNTTTSYDGNTKYMLNIIVGTSPTTAPRLATTAKRVMFSTDSSKTTPVYKPSKISEYYGNNYYYVNSIMAFLDMVNKALIQSFNALVIEYGTILDFPPKFVWNNDKIELLFDKPMILYEDVLNHIYITMNDELYYLFNTFPSKKIGNTTELNNLGCNNAIMLYNNYAIDSYSDNILSAKALKDVYVFYQSQSSVVNWTPVSSIYLSTHAIPVNTSMTGAPEFSGDNIVSSSSSNQDSLLTDFSLALQKGNEWQGQLYYIPSNEYRLFDLLGSTPLKTLNINIYWKSKLGFSYPFLMNYGSSCSIKIMFRKKSFNNI